jgi:hypothetical protein
MNAPESTDAVKPVSLKLFLLSALLWLPLSFFFWFIWAGLFVVPVQIMSEWGLAYLLGGQFRDLTQSGYALLVEIYFTPPDGTRLTVNPMIYGYGLPVLAGLVISTPNTIARRALQILVGYTGIAMVQSWGTVAEVLKNLTFGLGPEGRMVMEQVAISPTFVALAYQLGYLIFPAVIPVVLWVLMNRPFFEGIISSGTQVEIPANDETREDDSGQ